MLAIVVTQHCSMISDLYRKNINNWHETTDKNCFTYKETRMIYLTLDTCEIFTAGKDFIHQFWPLWELWTVFLQVVIENETFSNSNADKEALRGGRMFCYQKWGSMSRLKPHPNINAFISPWLQTTGVQRRRYTEEQFITFNLLLLPLQIGRLSIQIMR